MSTFVDLEGNQKIIILFIKPKHVSSPHAYVWMLYYECCGLITMDFRPTKFMLNSFFNFIRLPENFTPSLFLNMQSYQTIPCPLHYLGNWIICSSTKLESNRYWRVICYATHQQQLQWRKFLVWIVLLKYICQYCTLVLGNNPRISLVIDVGCLTVRPGETRFLTNDVQWILY